MSLIDEAKKRLKKAARKKHGKIKPCKPAYTVEGDMVIFWYNTLDDSTHLIHTHVIHEEVVKCVKNPVSRCTHF